LINPITAELADASVIVLHNIKDNHDKFYKMSKNINGTFLAEWGKIGHQKLDSKIYHTDLWLSTIQSKLKKGYFVQDIQKASSNSKINDIRKKLITIYNLSTTASTGVRVHVDSKLATIINENIRQIIIDFDNTHKISKETLKKLNEYYLILQNSTKYELNNEDK